MGPERGIDDIGKDIDRVFTRAEIYGQVFEGAEDQAAASRESESGQTAASLAESST